MIVAAVMTFFFLTALGAEKKQFVYSKKTEKDLSRIYLQDRTDTKYRIAQWSRLDVITDHNDPELVGAEQTLYIQSNSLRSMYKGDKGVAWGYFITQSKGGDCYYSKFQSTYIITVASPTAWESEAEMKFQIFGGTGKYEGVRGSGTCKSKGTPMGETGKCEGEWEF